MSEAEYNQQVSARADEMIRETLALGRGNSLWDCHARVAGEPAADEIIEVVHKGLNKRAGFGNAMTPVSGGIELDEGDTADARLYGGPFEIAPAMMLVCRWGDALPAAAVDRIRRFMTEGVLERGNTENHWLMFYVGNLLAAQRWPDVDVSWNGLSAAANLAEARRWILGMIERTATNGHHEYDSTGYHAEHVIPLMAVADHAEDEHLKRQARQVVDLLLADMALEFFKGAWAGGHSREGYRQNTWTRIGPALGLTYLYFGDERGLQTDHLHAYVTPALVSPYRPPPVLAEIAWDRTHPHVVKKTKAPRTIYRHVEREADPVRKYTYMSRSFALGSTQVGLPGPPAGPIDLTSWDLTWDGPKHEATIVCNHPYRSPGRFSAFLSGLPQGIGREVGTGKPYLQYPDRLFGASPFEQMAQHEGTIIVTYRIPADDDSPFVSLYLPRSPAWHERSGWLFADLGAFHVALQPLCPYTWESIRESNASSLMVREGDLIDGWMLRLPGYHPGIILEAVEADEVASFESYCEARAAASADVDGWPQPGRVAVNTHDGKRLELTYDGDHRVDGEPIDYAAYPLLGSPSVEAPLGSGRVQFRHGDYGHELDFGIDPGKPQLPMRVIG